MYNKLKLYKILYQKKNSTKSYIFLYSLKLLVICSVSVAQLVANIDNLCRGRSLNSGFPTSPHLMCVNLTTRLFDKKKKKQLLVIFMHDCFFFCFLFLYIFSLATR